MRALDLDYCTRAPRLQRLGWTVFMLAALAWALLAVEYQSLASATVTIEAELDRLNARAPSGKGGADRNPHADRLLISEQEQAREVLRKLAFPWEGMLAAIEEATSEKVALLGIEPDLKLGQVSIVGEAKDYPAVLDYIRRLEAADTLARVQLRNHLVQPQDPQHPVRFTLLADWGNR